MLRRFIVATATVAAFGILFGLTDAFAAGHRARGNHSHTSNSTSFNRHALKHNRRARRAFPYRRYGLLPYGGFVGESLPSYYTSHT
jgi:hypothetical protein